eukprot:SAG31_NODE_11406_length_1034_cov_1.519786_2_plen_170_part_00
MPSALALALLIGLQAACVQSRVDTSSCARVSAHDPPLRQDYRPPRQTEAQATAFRALAQAAVKQSAAARPWVVDYMGSDIVRSNLDPSLQRYSNTQLADAFEWEFARLPIFHNAPLDGADADYVCEHTDGLIVDDTPLTASLFNGNLQQPCQRFVLGGASEVCEPVGLY